jgi:hypothetical protein
MMFCQVIAIMRRHVITDDPCIVKTELFNQQKQHTIIISIIIMINDVANYCNIWISIKTGYDL